MITVAEIATICHEVNKAYCESINDHSQVSWNDAEQWQKNSAINGVIFHRDNPDAEPSNSHENWLKEKTETGWVYGEIKDTKAKTHPCCIPYDELPAEQRAKDYIFLAVVSTALQLNKTL